MDITVQRYSSEWKERWDAAVRQVRQSSFLFERGFMDYHSDRFQDASLIVLDQHEHIMALLPACLSRNNNKAVESHGGLTYGGLLLMPTMTTVMVGEALKACLEFFRQMGMSELLYKPVPYIYTIYPAEEDLYWLFRYGATLESRAVSSAIDLKKAYGLSTLRKRKVKKASKNYNFELHRTLDYLPDFWNILNDVLLKRHGTKPVHSLEELQLLTSRFPAEIQLLTVSANSVANDVVKHDAGVKNIVAGCLLFISQQVVHVQYIASSDYGCEICALDWLFNEMLQELIQNVPYQSYLDFGISTECGGTFLNEGLIFQKEGFGARAICYDTYKITF